MQAKVSRIYAIDMLRATMMLLGLVIHAGITYAIANFGDAWAIKDPHNTNILFDIVVRFIHTFRMPVFFVVSGFLSAMLFVNRGPEKMILNRLKRIVLPFIIGLLILYPLVLISFDYFISQATNPTSTIYQSVTHFINVFAWQNVTTIHLWFLYYLALFCICGWSISLLSQKIIPKTNVKISIGFKAIFQLKLAPVFFGFISYLLLCFEGRDFINTPLSFVIDIRVFLIYAYFFGFGWLLFHQKEYLERFKKGDRLFTALGIMLFIWQVAVIIANPGIESTSALYWLAGLNALSFWFFTFGIMGLFLRFFNQYSPIARYISDASYWIYLVHLPLVVFFQSTLVPYDFNPILKFLIVITATLIIAVVTYDFLVRNTFIGIFLNGKKYARGLPKSNLTPEVSLNVLSS